MTRLFDLYIRSKKMICVCLLIYYCGDIGAQKIVLWGNSISYYNNMPQNFIGLCETNQRNVTFECFTKPGVSVTYWYNYFHLKPNEMFQSIDYLVLQNNTVSADSFSFTLKKILEEYDSIKVKRIIIFENYSTISFSEKSKHEDRQRIYNICDTYRTFDSRIVVLPIGHIFQSLENEALFSDDYHPTLLGSNIYALGLYYVIYNQYPKNLAQIFDVEKYSKFIYKSIDNYNISN